MKWDKRILYYSTITIIACILYLPSINNSFTFLDDHVQVVENPFIKSLDFQSIRGIFSSFFVGMYQPITTLLYAITFALSGLNPTAFHAISLLFHVANCWLIFRLLNYFLANQNLSFLLCLVFLVHPMQVESVSWISALSNLVFSSFFLAAFWAYLKYSQQQKASSLLLCFGLFILSCLSKSAAVVFPVALIAFDFFKIGRLKWKLLLQKIPFFAVSILFGIITIFGRETAGHLSDLTATYSSFDRVFLVSHSVLFYPIKFLFPSPLSAFYPYPPFTQGVLPTLYYLSPVVLIGLGVITYLKRKNHLLLFGIMWFLITIALVLQFVPFGNQITTDRYLYLPLFGLLVLLGSVLQKLKNFKWLWFSILPLLVFSFLSFQRTHIWKNDEKLWKSVIETHPTVSQAYNNLGSYALEQNKNKKAFDYFNQAIQVRPNYADAYSNRGNLFAQAGNSGEAMKDFNKAIQLQPHADAYFNRANEYSKLNRLDQAILDYSRSIELQPRADSYTNRAFTYLKLKKISLAREDLSNAKKLSPNYGRAYFLEGILEQNLGNKANACAAFLKAANLGEKNANQAYSQSCR
jgi:tetratricopeptide (TPR) repeat protein